MVASNAVSWSPTFARPVSLPTAGVEVLPPRLRVPLSFVIDDSTCLVNMGHFCMPQFAAAWPEREIYRKPWTTWPREIPDAFVREFADFCEETGVRGKYSIVPYPACVGWLDRELPGWSRPQLQASLRLVRQSIAPRFDIHPEMITHTRMIDIRTGRPLPEISPATMENSYPRQPVSVDELAAYLTYALRILKNCELPCEGVTTPGGFGNLVKDRLGQAVFEAVRDVFGAELPHYFKYVVDDLETDPKLEHIGERDSDQPRLVANVPAATGDWFGGWDGDRACEGSRYCNEDATAGRLVQLIERNKPAVMLCHWPGLYNQGTKQGFRQFQEIVLALRTRFAERTQWMKLSEMGRYQAAKELTRVVAQQPGAITLRAPLACPNFTVKMPGGARPTRVVQGADSVALREAATAAKLTAGAWLRRGEDIVMCFDLPQGETTISYE